tara:strand:- start:406 stop:858 length:453 start_codon:yes stop_codon:yes gene_type:complete
MKRLLTLSALLLFSFNGWAEPIGIGCITQDAIDNGSDTYNWEFIIDSEKKNASVFHGKYDGLFPLVYEDYQNHISMILNESIVYPQLKTRFRWVLDKDTLFAVIDYDSGNGVFERYFKGNFLCSQDNKVLLKAIDAIEKEKERKEKRIIK